MFAFSVTEKPTVVTGFRTPEVTVLTGVPASTLNYWERSGLVAPSLRPSSGRRATRWWSITDVITVRAIRALRQAGCPMPMLRKARAEIRRWGEDPGLTDVYMCWTGSDVVVIDKWGTVRSAVSRPGQGILHVVVVPLLKWHEEFADQAEEVDLARLRRLAKARRQRPAVPVEATKLKAHTR